MRASVAFSLLLAVCGLPGSPATGDEPRVTIGQGTLVGKTMTSRLSNEFRAFQGIPFAAPPVGKLRFENPQDAPSWEGERLAQKEGSDCIQFVSGSEDCLYLNVYTPKIDPGSKGLPVMVWVHGGGFSMGSGSTELYGPEYLLDHGVVLVTINYRIAMLGFLNLGLPEAPGNYGLKDQVAALRWVKKNIAAFGGNPDSVTIFGESAGGASIHYLLISPLTKGLFHRAIVQSGSALNPWAHMYDAPKVGQDSAANLGCKQADPGKLLECLRALPAQQFIEEGAAVKSRERRHFDFAPSVEPEGTVDPFLPTTPRKLQIADVPVMTGVMTHEGMMYFILPGADLLDVQKEFRDKQDYYMMPDLGIAKYSPKWNTTWQKIESFYKKIDGDDIEQFLLLASDVDFVVGVDQVLRSAVASSRKNPVYYYEFTYDGTMNALKKLAQIKRPGTCHADELGYLFTQDTQGMKNRWTDGTLTDNKVIEKFNKLWTNFAKTGNPTPDDTLGAVWLPVEKTSSEPEALVTRYLDIGEKLIMKNESLNEKRMKFWSKIYKESAAPAKEEL